MYATAYLGATKYSMASLLVADQRPKLLLLQELSFQQATRLLDLTIHKRVPDYCRHIVDIPDFPVLVFRFSPSMCICEHGLILKPRELIAGDLLEPLPNLNDGHFRCICGGECLLKDGQRSPHIRTP